MKKSRGGRDRLSISRFILAGSVLASGVALPVFATTQAGPLIVTVTTSPNPEALLATTSVAKSVGAIGYATGSSGVGLEGYVSQPGSSAVEGLSLTTSTPGGTGVFGYAALGSGVLGVASSANTAGVYGSDTSGVGVAGSGSTGVFGSGSEGVVGITTNGESGSGVLGIDQTPTGAVGVDGVSSSGSGVVGTSSLGIGVSGSSKSSYGVEGVSSQSDGVYGESDATSADDGLPAGVVGVASNGTGVYGSSAQGVGVSGFGPNVGVLASSFNIAIEGYATGASSIGLLAYAESQSPYEHPTGIIATSSGTAVYGSGNVFGIQGDATAAGSTAVAGSGTGNGSYGGDFEASGPNSTSLYVKTDAASDIGLYINAAPGSLPLTVQNGAGPTTLLQLDSGGNLTLSGTLTTNDAVQSGVQDTRGNKRITYGPRMTERTLEDTGEAHLSVGRAQVAFDPGLIDVIGNNPYSVFLTPECDTPGLYVAAKERGGFVVAEHDGRSNCSFSYRVVVRAGVEPGHTRLDLLTAPRPVIVREPQLRASVAATEARIRKEVAQMKIRATHPPRFAARLKLPRIVVPAAPTPPAMPMRTIPSGLR